MKKLLQPIKVIPRLMALIKVLQEVPLKQLEWREIRSYLLAEKLQVDPHNQLLEIEGFVKGNYFNPNQPAHITGRFWYYFR